MKTTNNHNQQLWVQATKAQQGAIEDPNEAIMLNWLPLSMT